ncbi:hypothetical protein, partial [Bradyrhizobium diazoefficiens]
ANSTSRFLLAACLSVASGILGVGVLVYFFRLLDQDKSASLWLFAMLGLAAVGARTVSRSIIGSIGIDAVSRIRNELCDQISLIPLLDQERVGPSKLFTALTDDIGRVAAALPNVALLCANSALIIACLAYLAWLSVTPLLVMLTVVAAGITGHSLLRKRR